MLHEPAAQQKSDPASGYKTIIGGWMFLLYALIYIGFVAINILDAKMMERTVFMGLNLATTYGFGLIIFAMILALVYNALCTNKEKELGLLEKKKKVTNTNNNIICNHLRLQKDSRR